MTHDNADALNRYLDDLARGAAATGDDLDPDLLATIRRFRDLGAAPLPDPTVRQRMEQRIMNQVALAPAAGLPALAPRPVASGRERYRTSAPAETPGRLPHRGWAAVRLAAALLLVAAGLGYFALGPLRDDPNGPRSIPAAIGPVATPGVPEATPTATPFPMAGHPIIGVWQVTLESGNPGSSIAIFYFGADGSFTTAQDDDVVVVGSWRATGDRTAEMIYHQQNMRPPDVFAPGYTSAGPELLPVVWVWKLTATVDATGNTVVITGTIDMYRDGKQFNSFDGQNSDGVRMVPAEPGTTPTP